MSLPSSFKFDGNLILVSSTFINSLAPGKFEWNFTYVIFKLILVIDGWGIYFEIALIWMSLDLTDDQSTLVQVMAWCRQATSHYLTQCWPRSLSPYGVTKPQWVKWSLWYFAHVMTAVLSWHVQNLVAIWYPTMELHQNKFAIEFELWWKNHSWNGPLSSILVYLWKFL